MSLAIRDAVVSDIDRMVPLIVADARAREGVDPVLWRVALDAEGRVAAALRAAMTAERPPFRQRWLVAQAERALVGVAHTILLPVPPIYAGEFGPPGLIMEDCAVARDAPDGTLRALFAAAERDLVGAGAEVLLASSAVGGAWGAEYEARGYAPLTRYYASTALRGPTKVPDVRSARADDVAGIVGMSAENRRILCDLDGFWKPHAEADARFAAWMEKSLTLADRDMFVSDAGGEIIGYAISQPATPLHFPVPHEIGAIGVIDDFFHAAFADPGSVSGPGAAALLHAAEAVRAGRGDQAVLVVCPAVWTSKAAVLEAGGHRNAITWYRKR